MIFFFDLEENGDSSGLVVGVRTGLRVMGKCRSVLEEINTARQDILSHRKEVVGQSKHANEQENLDQLQDMDPRPFWGTAGGGRLGEVRFLLFLTEPGRIHGCWCDKKEGLDEGVRSWRSSIALRGPRKEIATEGGIVVVVDAAQLLPKHDGDGDAPMWGEGGVVVGRKKEDKRDSV